jgi:hypothetical protein
LLEFLRVFSKIVQQPCRPSQLRAPEYRCALGREIANGIEMRFKRLPIRLIHAGGRVCEEFQFAAPSGLE